MQSVIVSRSELQKMVNNYNKNYDNAYQKYKQADEYIRSVKADLPDLGIDTASINADVDLNPLKENDFPKICEILSFFAVQKSKDAVKAVSILFTSKCKDYRDKAIETLLEMDTKHAKKALERRSSSWLSNASKEEKEFIKKRLQG